MSCCCNTAHTMAKVDLNETIMRKAPMSPEQRRKQLLVKVTARSRGGTIKKVIPFRNNDVPNFLAELDRFEEESAKADLVVS
jgi:hypothetical protein